MPEKIDVLDDWGRKVGEFIPASAEGGWVGCFVLVALLAMLAIVAIPVLLLVKGTQYWQEGRKEEAVICFAVVFVIVITPFLFQVSNTLQQDAWTREQEERDLAFQRQLTEATEQIPQTITISDVNVEERSSRSRTVHYTVTNGGQMTVDICADPGRSVLLYFTGGREVVTHYSRFRGRNGRLEPGESQKCAQHYIVAKKEDRLESFCTPINVAHGGELRYICEEIPTP